MAGTVPALRATGLTKVYGGPPRAGGGRSEAATEGVRGLGPLDLAVGPGEAVALLGDNGSGKTTLLGLCAGLRTPSAGEVRIFGLPSADPAARLHVGFLPEAPRFAEGLRVGAFLDLCAALSGLDPDEVRRRGDAALDRMGLAGMRRERIAALSRGTRQRLAIAQALVHRPAILLLDEPLTGLDEPSRVLVVRALAEESRRGAALVVATHREESFDGLFGRTIGLVEGRVARDEPRAQAHPAPEAAAVPAVAPTPSSTLGFLAWEVVRETVRSRALAVVPVVLLLLAALTPLVRNLAMGGGDKASVDVGLGVCWLAGTFAAILLGSTAVRARDGDVWTLVRPVSRAAFTSGRFLGLCASLALADTGMILCFALVALAFGIPLPSGLALYGAMLFFETGLVAAWATLLSHLTRPALAAILTAALWAAGHQSDAYLRLAEEGGVPGPLPAVLFTVVPDLDLFDVQGQVVHGLAVDPLRAGACAAYSASWMVALVGLSVLATARRDLP